jgi:hypothetical protein
MVPLYRPTIMRRVLLGCVILVALGAAACAERPSGGKVRAEQPSPNGSSSPKASQRYEADAMVLQDESGPAMLCLGVILPSLPPQCGDVPTTNWDWDSVEGVERASGSIWGDYHVVGTYDGETFTVLEVGPRRPLSPDSFPEIEIPCPEPEGGWVAADPSRASESDREAVGSFAATEPDFAGFWVKILKVTPGVDVYGPNDVVVNVAFTGDLDRHRRELAEVWGGPLCVVRHERTEAELRRIQNELSDRGAGDFGIQVLSSDTDIVHNRVEVTAVLVDEVTEAAIRDRYGQGVVRLTSALQPVP